MGVNKHSTVELQTLPFNILIYDTAAGFEGALHLPLKSVQYTVGVPKIAASPSAGPIPAAFRKARMCVCIGCSRPSLAINILDPQTN